MSVTAMGKPTCKIRLSSSSLAMAKSNSRFVERNAGSTELCACALDTAAQLVI